MRLTRILAATVLLVGLSGCASTLENLAVSTTTATPVQAKTLAEAILFTTAAEKVLDAYAVSPVATRAVKDRILVLIVPVHDNLKKAEAANKAGNSALAASGLDAFNVALAALRSYEATNGVPLK